MKVVLYMAITANGMIAKEDDNTSFVSDVEWESFNNLSKEMGNYVMGRKTYEVSLLDNAFPYPDRLNVVMTNQNIENKWGDNVIFTNKSPKEILKLLEEKGFETTFVGGGGKINTSFLKENLVDEIYLDIEPILLGKGIKLFADSDFELKLELINIKKLSENEVQLHYKVLK